MTETTLTPEYVGAHGDLSVFRIDLREIDLEVVRSITIVDDGVLSGGVAAASGLDLDSVFFSHTRETTALGALQTGRLDNLDFSAAGIDFRPGYITPYDYLAPADWHLPYLFGADEALRYNPVASDLAAEGGGGGLSLGEGGSVTIRLDEAIGNYKLYLYFTTVGVGNDGGHVVVSDAPAIAPPAGIDLTGGDEDNNIGLGAGLNTHLGAGNDRIDGGGGIDHLYGAGGADTLIGGSGLDRLHGGEGADVLAGGFLDAFAPDEAQDHLYGGAGDDTYVYIGGEAVVHEDGAGGFDEVRLGWGGELLWAGDTLLVQIQHNAGFITYDHLHLLDQQDEASAIERIVFEGAGDQPDQVINIHKGFSAWDTSRTSLVGGAFDDVIVGTQGGSGVYNRANGGGGDDLITAGPVSGAVFAGGVGSDTLIGGAFTDQLFGDDNSTGSTNPSEGFGADSLEGGGGVDIVAGGFGADRLRGGLDGDTVAGGYGDDLYYWAPGDGYDVVMEAYSGLGSGGVDRIVFAAGITSGQVTQARSGNNLHLTYTPTGEILAIVNQYSATGVADGSRGVEFLVFDAGEVSIAVAYDITGAAATADNFRGGTLDDTLRGADGNDTLDGGEGNDRLDGGAGLDTARFDASGPKGVRVELRRTGGQDTGFGVDTLVGIENLFGSHFGDRLTGDLGANQIDGYNGDDLLSGDRGGDTLVGGAGDDTVEGGLGNDSMDGGLGESDTLSYASARAAVTVSLGLGGGPVQNTGEGIDAIAGFENLIGGKHGDVLTGRASLAGAFVMGGGGDDTISGAARLDGGAGDDIVIADGAETIDGGDGFDMLHLGRAGAPAPGSVGLTLDLGASTVVWGLAPFLDARMAFTSYLNMEGARGTAHADDLRGAGGANRLEGAGGRDVLAGMGGGDTLDGGLDRDTLHGGNGDDLLQGGEGNDVLTGGFGVDVLEGGAGRDMVSYEDATALVSVDLTLLGAQDTGGGGIDTLTAVEGVFGSAFDDVLSGDRYLNILHGGAGADNLKGFDGADQLKGGAGADVLTGGKGADIFIFEEVETTVDVIRDLGANDFIDLADIDTNPFREGNQPFVLVAAFSGAAGEIRLTYDAARNVTTLALNLDTDLAAEMSVEIVGDHRTFDNFLL